MYLVTRGLIFNFDLRFNYPFMPLTQKERKLGGRKGKMKQRGWRVGRDGRERDRVLFKDKRIR